MPASRDDDQVSEPVDLAAGSAERRQQSRDSSPDVLVVFPHSGGELARVLAELEELLVLVDLVDDGSRPLPAPLVDHQAAESVGRLAGYVAAVDGADETDRCRIQPMAPDGRSELAPLYFVRLDRDDRAGILGAMHLLGATRTSVSHPALDEALSDYTGDPEGAERLVARAERVGALLELKWDDDVDVLAARLAREDACAGTDRVVLTTGEYDSYVRVTERIVDSWHAGDPLELSVYRGTS